VHIDTHGAAIDLRHPDIDQIAQAGLDAPLPEDRGELHKFLEYLGRLLGLIDAVWHGAFSSFAITDIQYP
jgi:hypothetical protein